MDTNRPFLIPFFLRIVSYIDGSPRMLKYSELSSTVGGGETYNEVENHQSVFEDLQVEILEELDEKKFSVQSLKVKLTCARHCPDYSKYLKLVLSKSSIKTMLDLFGHITECWSFLDYGLLNVIIDKFGSKDLKQKMKTYASDLSIFRNKTKVAPFVRAIQQNNFHPRKQRKKKKEEEIFKKLIETINQDPNICTLARLDLLRTRHYDKLRELSLTQVALMVYDRIELCCVRITWLLLSEQVATFEQMFEVCIMQGTFFDENSIIHLELDGRVFMSMERVWLGNYLHINIQKRFLANEEYFDNCKYGTLLLVMDTQPPLKFPWLDIELTLYVIITLVSPS